jgi:hypothetical protein
MGRRPLPIDFRIAYSGTIRIKRPERSGSFRKEADHDRSVVVLGLV